MLTGTEGTLRGDGQSASESHVGFGEGTLNSTGGLARGKGGEGRGRLLVDLGCSAASALPCLPPAVAQMHDVDDVLCAKSVSNIYASYQHHQRGSGWALRKLSNSLLDVLHCRHCLCTYAMRCMSDSFAVCAKQCWTSKCLLHLLFDILLNHSGCFVAQASAV